MLQPFAVAAPAAGSVAIRLKEGDSVSPGTLLARIRQGEDKEVEMRSPLGGRVQQWRVREGQPVEAGDPVVLLAPDEAQVWEALRALYLIGEAEDLEDVELYVRGVEGMSVRVQEQARLTAEAIDAGRRSKTLIGQLAVDGFPLFRAHHVNRVPRAAFQERALRSLAGAQLAANAKQRVNADDSERVMRRVGHPVHAVFDGAVVHAGGRTRAASAAFVDDGQNLGDFLALVRHPLGLGLVLFRRLGQVGLRGRCGRRRHERG
jgi:biotin carboxyl carrier protein